LLEALIHGKAVVLLVVIIRQEEAFLPVGIVITVVAKVLMPFGLPLPVLTL
jgi:hypothetical protein